MKKETKTEKPYECNAKQWQDSGTFTCDILCENTKCERNKIIADHRRKALLEVLGNYASTKADTDLLKGWWSNNFLTLAKDDDIDSLRWRIDEQNGKIEGFDNQTREVKSTQSAMLKILIAYGVGITLMGIGLIFAFNR